MAYGIHTNCTTKCHLLVYPFQLCGKEFVALWTKKWRKEEVLIKKRKKPAKKVNQENKENIQDLMSVKITSGVRIWSMPGPSQTQHKILNLKWYFQALRKNDNLQLFVNYLLAFEVFLIHMVDCDKLCNCSNCVYATKYNQQLIKLRCYNLNWSDRT